MKVITEDREFSEFALRDGCIAVPFSVTRRCGDSEDEILVYEEFRPLSEVFAKQFSADPFSDEAVSFLKERLMLPMQSYGFIIPRDFDKRILVFRLLEKSMVNKDAILPECRLVTAEDSLSYYKNLTTHELELNQEDPDDLGAVLILDGAIVAYAVLNDYCDDETGFEISVECAPTFRRRGYATSCAALLSMELLSRGYTVSYKCRKENEASAGVARRAGFVETGLEYNFVCYRRTATDD